MLDRLAPQAPDALLALIKLHGADTRASLAFSRVMGLSSYHRDVPRDVYWAVMVIGAVGTGKTSACMYPRCASRCGGGKWPLVL